MIPPKLHSVRTGCDSIGRWIVGGLLCLAALPSIEPSAHAEPAAPAGDIASIEHLGEFIHECTLPGETRRDDVVPRHANAIQIGSARWLVVYSTHGYRGVDDERSIVYQIRRDAPDGKVLKEGFLARAVSGWLPPGVEPPPEGMSYFKQHGHMVAFGVPKGATLNGKPMPHANLFTAKWRVAARMHDLKRDFLEAHNAHRALADKTQGVEWVQFRLNDRDDDIEILQPVSLLRQKGFEKGPAFCSGKVEWMNQSFCPPVPANRDFTEWADANHFDGDRVAALKYRFNPAANRYDWVEMGPLLGEPGKRFFEASLVHLPDGWVVAGRGNGETGWARAKDPFTSWSPMAFIKEPPINSPLTAFLCADGVVRLFSGDRVASPVRNGRDPLYCWDVQAAGDFSTTNRREIFSTASGKLPIRPASQAKLDFCELFPLSGRTQLVVHGVSTRSFNHPYPGYPGIPIQNTQEKKAAGLYYARITYRREPPPVWQFSK